MPKVCSSNSVPDNNRNNKEVQRATHICRRRKISRIWNTT